MAQQPRNNVTQLRRRKRLPISAILLLLAFAASVVQYAQNGEVSWITDSFRSVETTAKELIGSADANRQTDKLGEYGARASRAVIDLGKEVQSATGLSSGTNTRSNPDSRSGISGSVMGVTDGDTIKVLDGDLVLHKVRLTGIDAPERGQPFAKASKNHLASMVAGKEVFVEASKKDQYGRVLGKVWVQPADCPSCGKTLDANHAQLLAGMAWWYRYYAKEQPPEDRGRYESAEEEAKARGWGLWADSDPINPYDWRRSKK
jgi:endonuclease YncB( thermonuclease family)